MGLIDRWITRIADFSVANNPQSPTRDMIVFAFRLLFNVGLTISLTLLICAASGHWKEGLIVLGSTVVLKLFTGNFHFQSIVWCVLYSTGSMVALAHSGIADARAVPWLSAVSIMLIYAYAPKNIAVFFSLSPDKFHLLKWAAIAVILLNCGIQMPLAALTFLLQSLSLAPWFDKVFSFLERRIPL